MFTVPPKVFTVDTPKNRTVSLMIKFTVLFFGVSTKYQVVP